MGKRELLIAAGFLVIAALTYQLTAPAPKDGERGFSLRRVFDNIKREIKSEATQAEFTQTGTIPVGPGTQELRINAYRSVPVTIQGEDRADIAYEMPVSSTGPDAATALDYAKRSVLTVDDLGVQITLSTSFPPEGSQRGSLTLKVPSRLAIRLDSVGRPKVRGVAALRLARVTGEVVVEDIRGAVTGTHVSGDLTVTGAGSVNLILVSSRAKFSGIERGLTLNARSGECEIRQSRGPLAFTGTSARLSVAGHDGPIDIDGEGGNVAIDRPVKPLYIDIRRTSIDVTLAAAVPVTIMATDETLRLTLDGPPAVSLDAIATDSTVDAAAFELHAETRERAAHLSHEFGGKAARVVLRNARGDIVIARPK